MAKPFENYLRITLYKSKLLNSEASTIPSFKLSFEFNSICSETEKVITREFDFGSKVHKLSSIQSFKITAYNTAWLSFSSSLGKISIPLSVSKMNDQRQWFYLKNDNDENVIGILTSLYCEVSDSLMTNNTLNNTKGNIYQRGEISCENLHSNLINTLLNRTMNAKESNTQCVTSAKGNNTCYLGSCDYTNDRTLQEDKFNIKTPTNNMKSNINLNIPTDNQPSNNNKNIFSPFYTERNVSFSLKELASNYSLQSIEAILNQAKDGNYKGNNSLSSNGELILQLSNKIKALNMDEEKLKSQMIINNQINDKIKEKENILKRERSKLEEKYRKYKPCQAEYETKYLNLAQSNIQFERDQYRFILEKEIFQQDKDDYININLMLSHGYCNNIQETDEWCDSSLCIKPTQLMITENTGKEPIAKPKKKKEIVIENALNYNVNKSKSKPKSTGSTTNYTSGNNSEVTSNDYQNILFNTSTFQDTTSNVNNTKYFAPIAEINLTNNTKRDQTLIPKNELFNNNLLVDSLECGVSGKKALPSNYHGRSALRKNSKQYTNGTNLHLTSEINSNNSRKKSVKNVTNSINRKISLVNNGSKPDKCVNIVKKDSNGFKSDSINNTVCSVSNTNIKNGLKLNKKIK